MSSNKNYDHRRPNVDTICARSFLQDYILELNQSDILLSMSASDWLGNDEFETDKQVESIGNTKYLSDDDQNVDILNIESAHADSAISDDSRVVS